MKYLRTQSEISFSDRKIKTGKDIYVREAWKSSNSGRKFSSRKRIKLRNLLGNRQIIRDRNIRNNSTREF